MTKRKGVAPEKKDYKAVPVYLIATNDDEGIVEAIVAVFGNVDEGDDVIHNGAFTKTLTERGHKVRVLDTHKTNSVTDIVGVPLEIRELTAAELPAELIAQYPDATGGLYTRTQYLLETMSGREVFSRIKARACDQYSIGYQALDTKMERVRMADGRVKIIRHIYTVKLYEYSPVPFAMNEATATISAKEMTPDGLVRRLGDYLAATIYEDTGECAADLLKDGYITQDDFDAIDAAIKAAVAALNDSLPEALALLEIPAMMGFYYFSNTPDAQKAGRVLSALNAQRIKNAYESLGEVLTEAGVYADMQDAAPVTEGEVSSTPIDMNKSAAEAVARDEALAGSPLAPTNTLRQQQLLALAALETELLALETM